MASQAQTKEIEQMPQHEQKNGEVELAKKSQVRFSSIEFVSLVCSSSVYQAWLC